MRAQDVSSGYPPASDAPFVGRARELGRLLRLVEAAGQGQGGVVLVAGEAGVGKTRLVQELATRARDQGWRVLVGRAYEAEGMPPYLPFVEALRDYARSVPAETLRAAVGGVARDVALLVPEVHDRAAGMASVPDGSGGTTPARVESEARRYQILESVTEFLLGIVHTCPVGLLLVLDDLHWADASTVHLLRHLAHRLARLRTNGGSASGGGAHLLVAGTYRTEGLDRAHALNELLADLSRDGGHERLALTPFSVENARALVAALAGTSVAPAVAAAIHRRTDGNPFFIREVVRHLLGEGHDLRDTRSAAPPGDLGVPQGVREVLRQRLARLSPAANRLLRAAAVMETGLTTDVLREVSGLEEEALLDALDEAIGDAVLVADGDGLRFTHALIRQFVYDELSPPRRQRLHLRTAQALEAAHAGNLGPHVATLAGQYRLAGPSADAEKAIGYSLRAGEAAMAILAYEEAAQHWRAALALMEERETAPERRAALLERLAALMNILGWDHYAQAIAYLEQALRLYAGSSDAERAAELHVRLGVQLSANNAATMDVSRAFAHFRAAEIVLGQGPARAFQSLLYAGIASSAAWGARTAEGLTASGRALEIIAQSGDDLAWLSAATKRGWHLASAGDLADGLALLERAWEVANDREDVNFASVASAWRADWGFFLADPRNSFSWRARELAKRRQAPDRRRSLLSGMAAACVEAGDLAEGQRLHAEASAVAPGAELDLLVVVGAEALLAFRGGDWERAEEFWEAARKRHRRTGSRWCEADFGYWLARLFRVRGDAARAETLLRETLAIGVEGSCVAIELWTRAELALVCAESARADEARSHLARCRAVLEAGEDWRGVAGRVALAEAVVAVAPVGAAVGEAPRSPRIDDAIAQAEPRFAAALETFRRHSLRWDEAEALYCWGRALTAARRPAAAEKLEAARAVYRQIGAEARWVERVDDIRGHAAAGAGRTRSAGRVDGLTEREVEVLRLLASGASNKRIAHDLVLSVRTVERHVANIYTKLDAHNRAEATAYAVRHGLLDERSAVAGRKET